jgi:hypothetical protein
MRDLLFRLPALGDNATMPTEPTKTDLPKCKRRWFQFRLRTLFVAMTILAVQCAVCFPALKEWQEQQHTEELMRVTTMQWRSGSGNYSSGGILSTSIRLDGILDQPQP